MRTSVEILGESSVQLGPNDPAVQRLLEGNFRGGELPIVIDPESLAQAIVYYSRQAEIAQHSVDGFAGRRVAADRALKMLANYGERFYPKA